MAHDKLLGMAHLFYLAPLLFHLTVHQEDKTLSLEEVPLSAACFQEVAPSHLEDN